MVKSSTRHLKGKGPHEKREKGDSKEPSKKANSKNTESIKIHKVDFELRKYVKKLYFIIR